MFTQQNLPLLFLVLLISMPASGIEFKDILTTSQLYDPVIKRAEVGVVEGCPDGTFRCARLPRRWELAVVLSRAAGYLEGLGLDTSKLGVPTDYRYLSFSPPTGSSWTPGTHRPFADVPSTNDLGYRLERWLVPAVKLGIFPPDTGYIGPKRLATRLDAVVWVARMLGHAFGGAGTKKDLAPIVLQAPRSCQGYVDFLLRNGIIEGYPDGKLHLNDPLTRIQMCVVAFRAIEHVKKTAPVALPMKKPPG
ncbi:MAG: S-layer homology domain-containing protein [Armatimonadetes bacterium]|nr:S-layer homology domain-containing protein [Armatimonadota bacterium]